MDPYLSFFRRQSHNLLIRLLVSPWYHGLYTVTTIDITLLLIRLGDWVLTVRTRGPLPRPHLSLNGGSCKDNDNESL